MVKEKFKREEFELDKSLMVQMILRSRKPEANFRGAKVFFSFGQKACCFASY